MNLENDTRALDAKIPKELQELAKTAKTIAIDDPRIPEYLKEKRGHDQYRSNFYRVFIGLMKTIRGEDGSNDLFSNAYLRNFTDNGIDPHQFYRDNKKLCDELFEAIDGLNEYKQLLNAYAGFCLKKEFELGARLKQIVPHPLGIEAVGMYSWDRVNILLKKADEVLKNMGVNTKGFGT